MLITNFILPSLNSGWVGIESRSRFSRCGTCVTPSKAIFEQAKTIWSRLQRDHRLKVDEGWCPDGLGPPRTFTVLENGAIDYARTCCRLSWYNHAQQAVEDSGNTMTASYTTMLLLEAVLSAPWLCQERACIEYFWYLKQTQFSNLLDCLKTHGANLSSILILPCGEGVTLMSRVMVATWLDGYDVSKEFYDLINALSGTIDHRYISTTTDIASLEANSSYVADCSLWGQYTEADVCSLTGGTVWSKSEDPKSSRIYVICDRGKLFGHNPPSLYKYEHIPWRLYAVSEADSDKLLAYLKSLDHREEIQEAICMNSCGIFQIPSSLQISSEEEDNRSSETKILDFVQDICDRSQLLQSQPEALLYMGKSQENIDRFIANKEAMLRTSGAPTEAIAQLKASFMTNPEKQRIDPHFGG